MHRTTILAARALFFAGLLAATAGKDTAGQRRPEPSEWDQGGRMRAYRGALVGPAALVGVAVTTAVDHARDDPPEWGESGEFGIGRRLASNTGRHLVTQTVRHGLAIVMDRSTYYKPCECTAFLPRVGNAFVEVITDRDRDGDRMFSVPRFAGAYAGAFAEQLWRPGRSGKEVAMAGASALVFGAAGNLWREFIGWP